MLSTESQQHLLRIARGSIAHGLETGSALAPEESSVPGELIDAGATFVTINRDGRLRGCIGSLQAHRPLYLDVAANAFAAAFRDPRFPKLKTDEFKHVVLEISLLSAPEPFPVDSEEDLLQQLVPGRDGLIIEDGRHRATFLPAVWESLGTPQEFVQHLKQKAGLPVNYWSDTMQVQRYTAEKICENRG